MANKQTNKNNNIVITSPKMLIYANKRKEGAADFSFFFHQKVSNWYLGNSKNQRNKQKAEKYLLLSTRDARS